MANNFQRWDGSCDFGGYSKVGGYTNCYNRIVGHFAIFKDSTNLNFDLTSYSDSNYAKAAVRLYDGSSGNFVLKYDSGYHGTVGTFPCANNVAIWQAIALDNPDAQSFTIAVELYIASSSTVSHTAYINVNRSLETYSLDIGTYIDGVKNDSGGEVSFDMYLNGVLNSNDVTDWCQSVSHGTTYKIQDITSKSGYRYNGVYSGSLSGTVTGTTSVYLSVSTRQYTIQYDANGGEGSIDSQTVKWLKEFSVEENLFTRNGYKFLGFYCIRNDKKWATTTSNVWATEEEIQENGYDYQTFQAEELHIIGTSWCDGHSDGVVFTFYAQWQPNTYTITFNGNGGTTAIDTLEVSYETEQNNDVSQYIPTRKAYAFLGWYSSPTDGIQVYDANGLCTNDGTYWLNDVCVYTEDYTLYAQWKVLNIIRYNHNGEWVLCYEYYKVNGKWYPCIRKRNFNGKYTYEIAVLLDEEDDILTDENGNILVIID